MNKRQMRVALFTAYLVILFRITVFRDGWLEHGLCSGQVIWLPFQTIFNYLSRGEIGYFLYLFVGNLIWFVPFGFALRLHGTTVWKTILLTAALSTLIEMLQFVLGTGCTETEDVLLNTTGGALGCALAALYRKIRS